MRVFLLVLVLANLLLLAYQYYAPQQSPAAQSALTQQLQPERIRLLSQDEVARMTTGSKSAACFELGPLVPNDLGRAQDAIKALQGSVKLSERRTEEPSGWWVLIPPLTSRQAANQRAAELKAGGIEDWFVIQDDAKFRNAISLGLYRSEEAATTRLEALRKRGVKDAEARPREGGPTRVFVQVRDAADDFRTRLAELKPSFPASDVRDCPQQ